MTIRQYKICKYIKGHDRLKDVLAKNKISGYEELQEIMYPLNLVFSDSRFDDKTSVRLSTAAQDLVELRQREIREITITRVIAVYGAAISTILLFLSIIRSC